MVAYGYYKEYTSFWKIKYQQHACSSRFGLTTTAIWGYRYLNIGNMSNEKVRIGGCAV